ncbi:MAG: hypothetical protein ACRD34_02960, partial [Bryobacteraceae bacterium]
MQDEERPRRQMPIGAEFIPDRNAVHFRLWAPKAGTVEVCAENRREMVALRRESDGYFSGFAQGL